MLARKPAVAGSFYPESASELKGLISASLTHRLFHRHQKRRWKAGLVPHAGYVYSGACAASFYSSLSAATKLFVILGTNHTGMGAPISIAPHEKWLTPLGESAVELEIAKQLQELPQAALEPLAHIYEHSIEVQLPFIQYFFPEAKILPIVVGLPPNHTSLPLLRALGEKLREVLPAHSVVLASSDMSHYLPASEAERRDKAAIEALLRVDPEELFRVIHDYKVSMCGASAAAAMLYYAEDCEGKLLDYYTSGDVMEMDKVVGYAAMGFV